MPRPATIKQRTPKVDTSRRGMAFASQDLTRAEGLSGYDVVARPVATVAADTSALAMQSNKLASYAQALGSVNPAINAVGKAWLHRNQVQISDYETRVKRGETLSPEEMEDWKAQVATDRIDAQDNLTEYRMQLLEALAQSQGDLNAFRASVDKLDQQFYGGKSSAYLAEFVKPADSYKADAFQKAEGMFLTKVHDEHLGKAMGALNEEYEWMLGGVFGSKQLDEALKSPAAYGEFLKLFDEEQGDIIEGLQKRLNELKETYSLTLSNDEINSQFLKTLTHYANTYGVLPEGVEDIKGPDGIRLGDTKISTDLLELRAVANKRRLDIATRVRKAGEENRKESANAFVNYINEQVATLPPNPTDTITVRNPDGSSSITTREELVAGLHDQLRSYANVLSPAVYEKQFDKLTSIERYGFAQTSHPAVYKMVEKGVANGLITSPDDLVDYIDGQSLSQADYQRFAGMIKTSSEVDADLGVSFRQVIGEQIKGFDTLMEIGSDNMYRLPQGPEWYQAARTNYNMRMIQELLPIWKTLPPVERIARSHKLMSEVLEDIKKKSQYDKLRAMSFDKERMAEETLGQPSLTPAQAVQQVGNPDALVDEALQILQKSKE